MKKLLSAVFLFSTVTFFAQTTPAGYDGGSDLQKAILKSRSKKPVTKTKSKKQNEEHIIVVETDAVLETREEKLYRIQKGHSHPNYVKRVMASKQWKEQQKFAEEEELKNYAERVEKRKQDSISKVEEQKLLEEQQRKLFLKVQREQDSLTKVRKDEREKYLEEQREAQRKNRRRSIFNP